ncbi:MAG: cadherin-like domain-containing protein [Cyanobacteria bacterium CRU_2_1]|nr:cadherin-like domain-containing protein [Cyanobacteria bacterium CRU_2_1]
MKIGFTANPTTLIEDNKTVFTLTFTLDQPPPTTGLLVTIDSDTPRALAELDVFAATFSGARLASANADASGLTLRITQHTATVTLSVFDDDVEEGVDRFIYTLQPSNDYTIDPNASTVTLTILDQAPVNTAPVAADDSYSTNAGTALTVGTTTDGANGVLANDTDAEGNPLTATVVTAPTNGSLTLNGNGSFVYVPNANFIGSDSFTYQANDGAANSNPATVRLVISSVTPSPSPVTPSPSPVTPSPSPVPAPSPTPSPSGTIFGTPGRDRSRERSTVTPLMGWRATIEWSDWREMIRC